MWDDFECAPHLLCAYPAEFGLPERQRTLRKPIFTGKIIAKPCFYNNHPRASCRVVLKYSLGVMPYSFLKARKKWL